MAMHVTTGDHVWATHAASSDMHTLTFQILIVKDLERFLFWALQPLLQPVALWTKIETQTVFQSDPMDFISGYNPSQAFTEKHVSYPRLTATRSLRHWYW